MPELNIRENTFMIRKTFAYFKKQFFYIYNIFFIYILYILIYLKKTLDFDNPFNVDDLIIYF